VHRFTCLPFRFPYRYFSLRLVLALLPMLGRVVRVVRIGIGCFSPQRAWNDGGRGENGE